MDVPRINPGRSPLHGSGISRAALAIGHHQHMVNLTVRRVPFGETQSFLALCRRGRRISFSQEQPRQFVVDIAGIRLPL
jgi:hypothetical protein